MGDLHRTAGRVRGPVGALLLASATAWLALAGYQSPVAATPRGHGSITDELDCSACHTAAGWKSLTEEVSGGGFDHDQTGFPLRGQHAFNTCTQCHSAERTLTRRCNGCHEDAHQGRLSADCSQCHNSQTWLRTDAIERHRLTRLPLSGMHAVADCVDCHRRGGDRAWSSVPADCFACHIDDYRRPGVHPVHDGSTGQPLFDRNCASCHRATGWAPAIVPIGRFESALTVSPLTRDTLTHDLRFPIGFGPHRVATCGDCHRNAEAGGALQCVGCHAHSKGRLLAQHKRGPVPTQARACLSCHPGGAVR